MLAQIETAEEASRAGKGVFVRVEDGERIDPDLFKELIQEEDEGGKLDKIEEEVCKEFEKDEVCENRAPSMSIGEALDDNFNEWIKTQVSALKNRSGAKTRAIKW